MTPPMFDTLVDQIVSNGLQDTLVQKTRLTTGRENIVYRIVTRTGTWILRLNQHYRETYHKEKWAMAQARQSGVAVPQVYATGAHQGYDYMVMEYIDGVTGHDYTGDMQALYTTLGRYAAQINAIETRGYGHVLVDETTARFDGTWPEQVEKDVDYIFGGDFLRTTGVLHDRDVARVKEMFMAQKTWTFPSRLSHNDLNLANVLIDAAGTVFLIDWSRASGQPWPVTEIGEACGRIADPRHVQAFLEGYGCDGAWLTDLRDDIRSAELAYALRGLRWAVEDNPTDVDDFAQRSRNALKHVLPPI